MRQALQTYGEYKDSGIEWIGKIPEHWDVKHFKQFSTMKGRIGWQGLKHSEFIDEGPFLITGMNFKDGKIRWNEVYHITEERYQQAPEIQLKEHDVLMTKDGTIGKLLYVDEIPAPYKASLNSHLLVFRPIRNSYFPRYLYYQLGSSVFQCYVEIAKTGTTFFGISQAAAGRYIAILPSISEQKAIAHYLDTKTAQIDRKIDLLTQKAQRYEELKRAIVNETVTRGLDKSVPMKDSGIEWIGEIPEHWNVIRNKDIFEESKNKAGATSSDYKVLSLTLKGVIERDLTSNKGKIPASFDSYQIVQKDQIVLCLFDMDVTPRIVGYIEQEGLLTSAYTILKSNPDVCMKYYYYYFLAQNENKSLLAHSKTLRSTLRFDDFCALPIPKPTTSEQRKIADYLDKNLAQINQIIQTINIQIEKQKELRKTLINDVVTGKIKVA